MDSESFSIALKNYNYLKSHQDYAIMRQIFNQNNIGMMLDKTLDPDEYINQILGKVKQQSNLNNICNVIDKKDIDIITFLIQIKAKIKYISSGTTGHFFQGAIYQYYKNNMRKRVCSFALKISAYLKNPKYKSIYEISRPENTEINMLNILSKLIIENKTKHLILPIKTYYTDIMPFVKMYKDNIIKRENDKNGKYKEFVEKYDNGLIENTVSVLICEFANGGDFLKFLRVNSAKLTSVHWRVFMFQLLSVLAVIQEKYPSFRHNDLKANNILVEITNPEYEMLNNKTIDYDICGKKYKIPDIGLVLKLWDFDFACIPKICENIKVHENWTNKINITTTKNQYYDIHYFFRTLISSVFFPEVITSKDDKYNELKKFISDILPKKYFKSEKLSKHGRLLVNDEYTTPKKLLETNEYFSSFRVEE